MENFAKLKYNADLNGKKQFCDKFYTNPTMRQIIKRSFFSLARNLYLYNLASRFYFKLIRPFLQNIRSKRVSKHGKEILFLLKDILEKENIFFWLEYGTLLGAYREKGFIKHEDDIDLGIFLSDADKLYPILSKHGFRRYKLSKVADQQNLDGRIEGYYYKNVSIDFYSFQIDQKDQLVVYSFPPMMDENANPIVQIIDGIKTHKARVKRISFPNDGFEIMEFLGRPFNVPSKTDKHLATHYGPDFMTPKKKGTYEEKGVYFYPEDEIQGVIYPFDK